MEYLQLQYVTLDMRTVVLIFIVLRDDILVSFIYLESPKKCLRYRGKTLHNLGWPGMTDTKLATVFVQLSLITIHYTIYRISLVISGFNYILLAHRPRFYLYMCNYNNGKYYVYKQRVLMHRHQGWNVRHGLCHIYMRYLYIYELFIAFVCFVVCSLL